MINPVKVMNLKKLTEIKAGSFVSNVKAQALMFPLYYFNIITQFIVFSVTKM